ncbi:MAG: FtsW/RodA/SpoVE family cell cycle protein, partial [Candidatus Gribaldobacteria bacterium]|nr:FtsW/RodA/SpoVE family cell cycle protein [Candidatus Gribaldobacteria bacterium]
MQLANILKFLKRIDWALLAPAFFLTIAGLIAIYSCSLTSHSFLSFSKQLIFFGGSLILVIALQFFDWRSLKVNSYLAFIFYVIGVLSLVGVLFLGTTIRGNQGWYKLGPVSLEPVPFVVIALIIVLSKYFSSRHTELSRLRIVFFSGLYVLIPVGLVLLQPDLGSALGLLAIWLGIIIFSGIRWRHLLLLAIIFSVVFALGWALWLKDYQKQRILSFLNPETDRQGVSWNVNQSKIAIGSGGILGKGIGKGSQVQYGFLPEPKTDFIFSALAEETGFVGVVLLFGAFLAVCWRVLKIAFLAQDNFTRLFATGLVCYLLSQEFINVGMCLGLFPVVGIPLPFVSYGGSHL